VLASQGRTGSLRGAFAAGRLHGLWQLLDAQGHTSTSKQFDEGFLSRHCQYRDQTAPTCSNYLRWRQLRWSCELPGGKPRLFASKSQLAAALPCAADGAGVRWEQERLIGVPRAGRASPSSTVRAEAAGQSTKVTANIQAHCGGARAPNSTLWLAVARDGKPWQLGPIHPTCLPTP
jgi:hypothetical protein